MLKFRPVFERYFMSLIPVILCGGVGSRLWPVSREMHPKPFIRLSDGQTLLQKAFLRASGLAEASEILTVTNRDLFFKIEDEFAEVNTASVQTSFILEPVARNTAAAIASAALHIAEHKGKETLMLILGADHLILDEPAFQQAVSQACALARQGRLVTFGIEPHSPEVGYGYIEAEGNEVLRFVEKPSLEEAQGYLTSGRFLWNSGMFCFTAGALLKEMEQYCPTLLNTVRDCLALSRVAVGKNFTQLELEPKGFAEVEEISIDYAIMEKSKQIAVVPCNIGWSDVGSWTALGDLLAPDQKGNRVDGDAILENTENCTIQSPYRIVAAVGLDNLIIVDTPDAVLVADKDCVQAVKNIYASLKLRGHDSHKLHRTVHRPWGTYTVLEEGAGFKIKRIEVKPGGRLSLQQHQHRCEHWVVVSGVANITNNGACSVLQANESTYISAGHTHRLENLGQTPVVLIEVQTGSYVGEDDIVRFDDIYGRAQEKRQA
jgi:mannose-1-phosphate guanylyltransferase/mannose-6-phosphate isomerase